jgi:sec-independent protein translocase protein TatB
MFGFGWGEIVVIGIVALIAIGPKELPSVLRSLGHWMGKIRRMANEFQGQFNEALREVELSDLKKQAEEVTQSITSYDPLGDTQKEIEKTFTFDDPLKDPPQSDAFTDTVTTHAPDAPPLPEGTVPDGALLPASALPPIDVPMPELPPPVTEKDFAPATPAVVETPKSSEARSSEAVPDAKLGGSAS